ncbi:four helix bundle protein [Candidatus Kaiserbacteria bacterium]|nr:four helix bundle protein [Candidatus Kaiserbacteria bacterium]
MAGGYRELIVWQKAMDLVVSIYTMTEKFPKSETFGLTSQMRRSAVSIPSNIAEGSKRSTKADFRNFLCIALGSVAELETQMEIAQRVRYADATLVSEAEKYATEVSRMLSTMIVRSRDS